MPDPVKGFTDVTEHNSNLFSIFYRLTKESDTVETRERNPDCQREIIKYSLK